MPLLHLFILGKARPAWIQGTQTVSITSGEETGKEEELFLGAWGARVEEAASFLGRPALSTLRRSARLCVRERDFRKLRVRDLGAHVSGWGILSSFKLPLGLVTQDCGVLQSTGPRITSYMGPKVTKPGRHDQQIDFISHTNFFWMIDGGGLGYCVGKDCKAASGLSKREGHPWLVISKWAFPSDPYPWVSSNTWKGALTDRSLRTTRVSG